MIDCHCHVLPPEVAERFERYASRDPHLANLLRTKGARFVTGEELVEDMKSHGVRGAVVFGFAFLDTGVSREINNYVADLCRRYRGVLVGFGVLCPESPGALMEAERCLQIGLAGFGELFPAGHGFSLEGRAMTTLAGLAAEASVPLLIHVNEPVGHDYPGKGDVGPVEAWRFAQKNPRTRVIFAHLGGGLPLFFAMREVRSLTNAYYDTAAQPFIWDPQVYLALKHIGALGNVLLGTDYPLVTWPRYVDHIRGSGLSAAEAHAVLYGNARDLFPDWFKACEGNSPTGQNSL